MSDWIEWKGGPCPVHPETTVEIRLRDDDRVGGLAGNYYWRHGCQIPEWEIVAYRVVEDYVAPKSDAARIAELEAQILTLKADLAGDAAMIEKMREEWIKTEATLGACVAEFAVERQRLTRIRSILEDLIAGNHSASVEQQARQALAITYEGERT